MKLIVIAALIVVASANQHTTNNAQGTGLNHANGGQRTGYTSNGFRSTGQHSVNGANGHTSGNRNRYSSYHTSSSSAQNQGTQRSGSNGYTGVRASNTQTARHTSQQHKSSQHSNNAYGTNHGNTGYHTQSQGTGRRY